MVVIDCKRKQTHYYMSFIYHLTYCLLLYTDGCSNGCNSHGLCQLFGDGWRCNCREGWKGPACNVAMEMVCENDEDDDNGK